MIRNLFPLSFILPLFYLCSCHNNKTVIAKSDSRKKSELKSIFINGDTIHYIDVGKGDPVVFVHGAFGDLRTWGAQMDTFTENHRVISYSQRLSYPNKQIANDSTDLSAAAHTEDLTELLKALHLGPVHLIGHSSGGCIALFTTIEHPELVRSLVLGEAVVPSLLKDVPNGDSVMNNFFIKTIKPTIEAFKSNDDEKGVRTFVNGVMGDTSYFNKLSPQIRENMMTNTAEVKHNILHEPPSPKVTCDVLKKVKIPTLLLGGDKSIAFFSLMNDELYHCLANREMAVLANTAHGLEYENPSEFNKVVLNFIDRH
jgi:pimeloyl-ACP methyl ester carboxylesterase